MDVTNYLNRHKPKNTKKGPAIYITTYGGISLLLIVGGIYIVQAFAKPLVVKENNSVSNIAKKEEVLPLPGFESTSDSIPFIHSNDGSPSDNFFTDSKDSENSQVSSNDSSPKRVYRWTPQGKKFDDDCLEAITSTVRQFRVDLPSEDFEAHFGKDSFNENDEVLAKKIFEKYKEKMKESGIDLEKGSIKIPLTASLPSDNTKSATKPETGTEKSTFVIDVPLAGLTPGDEQQTVLRTRVCVKSYPWPWEAFQQELLASFGTSEFATHRSHLTKLMARFESGEVQAESPELKNYEKTFLDHAAITQASGKANWQRLKAQVEFFGAYFYCLKLLNERKPVEVLNEIATLRTLYGISPSLVNLTKYDEGTYFSLSLLRNILLVLEYQAQSEVYQNDLDKLIQSTVSYLDARTQLDSARGLVPLPDPRNAFVFGVIKFEIGRVARHKLVSSIRRNKGSIDIAFRGVKTHKFRVSSKGVEPLEK